MTTDQGVQRAGRLDKRALGSRLVPVLGLLLAMDLLFLPWHHFSLDLHRFGLNDTPGVTLDRSGVEGPRSGLGIAALVVAAVMVASVTFDWLTGPRLSAEARARRDRIPLVAGPLVLALLLLKLILETQFLGVGAWLGLVFAAGLAYGGVAIAEESVRGGIASAAPGRLTRSRLPDGGPGTVSRQQRWVFVAGLVVVGTVAAAWLQRGDNGAAPLPDATSLTTAGASAGADAAPATGGADGAGAPAAGPSEAETAPGTAQTVVEPSSADSGSTVVASAGGVAPDRGYVVKIHRDATQCARGTQIGGPTTSTESGEIPATDAVLPTTLTAGRYFVCFAQLADSSQSTGPVAFVVP